MGGATPPYTAAEVDDALTALIAFAGNASGACKYLESVGKRAPTPGTLKDWARTLHWERYEQLREKFAEKNQDTLANNFLDAARFATDTAMLAVEKARDRLEAGKDDDPGRTAANLARVAQSATDKRLSLQGVEKLKEDHRSLMEVVRSLVGKGILEMTEPPQLEAGDGSDDDSPAK